MIKPISFFHSKLSNFSKNHAIKKPSINTIKNPKAKAAIVGSTALALFGTYTLSQIKSKENPIKNLLNKATIEKNKADELSRDIEEEGFEIYKKSKSLLDEVNKLYAKGEEVINGIIVRKITKNSDKTVMEEFSPDGSKLLRRTTFLPDKTIISKGIENTPFGSEKTQETYKFFQNELSEYSQNTQTKNDSKKASRVFLYAFDGFLIEYSEKPEILDKNTIKAEKRIEYSFDTSPSNYYENVIDMPDGSTKASKAINEYNEYFENYEWNEPQKRTKAEKMVIFDEKNKPSRVYFGYDANNKTIEKSYTITQKGAKDTTKEDIEKEFYNFV